MLMILRFTIDISVNPDCADTVELWPSPVPFRLIRSPKRSVSGWRTDGRMPLTA